MERERCRYLAPVGPGVDALVDVPEHLLVERSGVWDLHQGLLTGSRLAEPSSGCDRRRQTVRERGDKARSARTATPTSARKPPTRMSHVQGVSERVPGMKPDGA